MELLTQQTNKLTRVDRIIRIQLDIGSDALVAYFNKLSKIDDEEFGEQFDSVNPVTIPIQEISQELKTIFSKAIQYRALQLAGTGEAAVVYRPDYKTFLGELLSLEIFRLAQEQAKSDQVLNVAYTDFSVMLSNAISGVEIIPALQASFDAILENLVLADDDKEYLEPLRDAIARCNIPLNLPKNEE